jgi:ABC-type uncharacterized transport system fused permease/ATPase subunit
LTDRLKHTTIVSIAHRSELARFHGHRVELRQDARGVRELSSLTPQTV